MDVVDLSDGKLVKTIKTYDHLGKCLAVCRGKIYVADAGSGSRHRICRYDLATAAPGSDGYVQPEASYTLNRTARSLWDMSAMAGLPDGNLFLGLNSSGSDRLAILNTSNRQFECAGPATENTDGYSDAVYNPADGKVYVTEMDTLVSRSGILRLGVNGGAVAEQFVDGAAPGYTNTPSHLSGIAADPDGRIMCCSDVRGRISLFGQDGTSLGDLPVTGRTS